MSSIHRKLPNRRNLPISSLLAVFLFQGSLAYAKPVELVVKLKERVPVQALADNVVKYGVVYTPEQIRALSAPSDEDYSYLLQQLRQEGFEIVTENRSHLFVTIRAEKESVENTFQTKLLEEETTGARRAITPATVPANLDLIEAVVGLDNTHKRYPHYKFDAEMVAEMKKANAGTAQPGVLPATIKSDYGFSAIYKAGYTGKGQHIAIATYDNIHVADVTAYYKKIALSPVPAVDVVSFNGTATYNMDSAMETELDTEFSGMIAPGAAIHVFASADNSDAGELAMFTAILNDGRAKVVNYSWGSCEAELDPSHKTAMDTVYAQAVAQGVNIMVASGDSGSAGCQDNPNLTSPDYPAIQPDVVAVGGNTLVDSGGTFETAWSGSGGGISADYALPSYQKSFSSPYTMRSIPDVSFNADPNSGEAAWEFVDADGSQSATAASWVVLGGTSIAAPQWSGFLALVGEARAGKKLATLGFLNPRIYALSAAQKAAAFHDVTSGSNGAYSAGPGWDAVSGWGSMNANALLGYLTAN